MRASLFGLRMSIAKMLLYGRVMTGIADTDVHQMTNANTTPNGYRLLHGVKRIHLALLKVLTHIRSVLQSPMEIYVQSKRLRR